jgi:hypothetical protein
MALFFLPLDVHEKKGSACAHYKLAARFGYCSSARKMVALQIRFVSSRLEVLEVSCDLYVVAHEFSFHDMTFVSDHMPLCRS